MTRKVLLPVLLAALFAVFSGAAMAGNLPPMGIPLTTTIIVTKPAPGQVYGDKQPITFGVGDKQYKFVLNDAYVDSRKYHWPDIWEYVSQFRPNLVVQGGNGDQIVKIEPGQTVTIKGMFAAMDRTFEVMSVEQGGEGASHY